MEEKIWKDLYQTETINIKQGWGPTLYISIHMDFSCHRVLSCFSRVWLFATLWPIALQVPLSRGFSRQKYWSGLPFPPPGDLPDPGIESTSPLPPILAGRFFYHQHHLGSLWVWIHLNNKKKHSKYNWWDYWKTFSRMVIGALFIIVRNWKQFKCPLIGEWINYRMIYSYTGIVHKNKKGWINDTWMNFKNIMLSNRSWTLKNIYYVIPFIWSSGTKLLNPWGEELV